MMKQYAKTPRFFKRGNMKMKVRVSENIITLTEEQILIASLNKLATWIQYTPRCERAFMFEWKEKLEIILHWLCKSQEEVKWYLYIPMHSKSKALNEIKIRLDEIDRCIHDMYLNINLNVGFGHGKNKNIINTAAEGRMPEKPFEYNGKYFHEKVEWDELEPEYGVRNNAWHNERHMQREMLKPKIYNGWKKFESHAKELRNHSVFLMGLIRKLKEELKSQLILKTL